MAAIPQYTTKKIFSEFASKVSVWYNEGLKSYHHHDNTFMFVASIFINW